MRSLLFSLLSLGVVCAHEEEVVGFTFAKLESARLPKPLSDFSISFDESSQLVYIAGGCDAEQGNVYVEEIATFVCSSSSSEFYSFDRNTNSFETLAPLPVARYRHGAALVNGKIWLVGGRDVEVDGLLPTVDVYDIASNTWATYDLPEAYQTSDNVAFTNGEVAYVAGGYDATYGFKGNVFTIAEDGAGSITIVDKTPLLFPRGDHTAVTLPGTPVTGAIVTGGFGAADEFCAPLVSVEQYDFAADTWTQVADLNQGRGDKALVALGDHIFAMGGERPVLGICEMDSPEPGEKTLAIDDLEIFHADENEWVTLMEDLPSHRFRFSAVGYNDIQSVYVFGGQKDFNETCNCFVATDEILTYTEQFSDNDGTVTDDSPAATPTAGNNPTSLSSSGAMLPSLGRIACAYLAAWLLI
ncbi:kelch repeat and BTB domain-containing protein 5/10 [Fistulifera solaris]|uniref:Kelch repeat and BTB domain-containing protein 5/10 n=1 Tax=Fistulifera solaris TaxID=1519565 RepID=A0A1Z5KQB5_FISSO|nr:kelch repeat and BTB domain-containing protein 5/10 [Fistulifera solaris]|eukprot:GAX28459.1 kelch repeat and BTB domain-containing protein 5/10 [Fistulifera solaris]